MTTSEPPATPEPITTDRPDRPGPPHTPSRHILHTPAEAATLLRVKESWLRRHAGQRTIASTMLGKHLRFSDADLAQIAENARRPPRQPRPGRRGHRSTTTRAATPDRQNRTRQT